jgi:autotransporter-associated beta strand protein
LAGRLCAALLGLIGSFATVHAADIAEADVTATLWPGGAPYTFFDTATTGGGDYGAVTTATFDRSFGTLNVGSSGSQIVVRGLGWASAGTSFTATRVIATITYLGANGTNGGGDDVLIGKATNNVVANTTAAEWSWVFDAPLTNTIDGLSNMFRITLTLDAGATGTMKFKTTSGTLASAVKLSVAGSTTAVGAGDPLARKWVGGVDGNWDTSTLNWSDNVNPAAYADGKNVTLDDTLSVSPLNNYITLAGTYSPSNIVVNNTTYDYHLGGGGLAGNMTLTKQGTNVFSLSMSNSYTGVTTISAGTLEIDDAHALGSISGGTVVNAGGSLALNNGITLDGEPLTLSGGSDRHEALRTADSSNPVTVSCPITLGANAYIGTGLNNGEVILTNCTITDNGNNYTLRLNPSATGSKLRLNTAGITVSNVYLYTYQTTAGLLTFGVDNCFPNSVMTTDGGLFDLNGTSQSCLGWAAGSYIPKQGYINNSSATTSTLTLNIPSGRSFQSQSVLEGNLNLVVNGPGSQTLGGGAAHTYTGTTLINGANVGLACSMSGVTGDVTVTNGGTLHGYSTIGGSVTINSGCTFYPGYTSNQVTSPYGLNVLGNLTLNPGSTTIACINPDLSPSNNTITVSGTLTYGGTLVVYSVGHTNALQAGETFTIFPNGGTGNFDSVVFNSIEPQPGTTLSFNPATGTVTVNATTAPTLSVTPLGGNVMQINWDSSFYKLQMQTNSLATGLSNNWMDCASANGLMTTNVTNDPTIPATFFRLAPKP